MIINVPHKRNGNDIPVGTMFCLEGSTFRSLESELMRYWPPARVTSPIHNPGTSYPVTIANALQWPPATLYANKYIIAKEIYHLEGREESTKEQKNKTTY